MTPKALPAPLPDCRFVQFGSEEHGYYRARGWIVAQQYGKRRIVFGDPIVLVKGAPPWKN